MHCRRLIHLVSSALLLHGGHAGEPSVDTLQAPPEEARVAPFRPCTPNITEDCVEGRFVQCGTIPAWGNVKLLNADHFDGCGGKGLGKVQLGEEVLVQFTKGRPARGGQCLEILMRVGECWGPGILRRADYDCMGRCGGGCQKRERGVCSNWSLNCLKHDVCSYYYQSRGGNRDPSCGYLFFQAEKDYTKPCFSDHSCRLEEFNTVDQVCHAETDASRYARYFDVGIGGGFHGDVEPVKAVMV